MAWGLEYNIYVPCIQIAGAHFLFKYVQVHSSTSQNLLVPGTSYWGWKYSLSTYKLNTSHKYEGKKFFLYQDLIKSPFLATAFSVQIIKWIFYMSFSGQAEWDDNIMCRLWSGKSPQITFMVRKMCYTAGWYEKWCPTHCCCCHD